MPARPGVMLLRVGAWLLLGGIAMATLGPAELRPSSGGAVQIERLGAFLLLGAAFGAAYPTRRGRAFAIVCIGAVGLELLQALLPDRHGLVADAAMKLAGAVTGFGAAWLVTRRVPGPGA